MRSDLQDGQPWTKRNAIINSLAAAGTIAAGYQFATTSVGFTKGTNAYNGIAIPALQALWPDQIQLQLNRISDYGFNTNHLIPKQHSEIVVAFFPLDRFLTPPLKRTYLKSPPIFFVPGAALANTKTRAYVLEPMRALGVFTQAVDEKTEAALVSKSLFLKQDCDAKGESRNLLSTESEAAKQTCFTNAAGTENEEYRRILTFLSHVSLNRIHIDVSGVMTVDVDSVPANLTSVDFLGDIAQSVNNPSQADFWKSSTAHTGQVTGTFLGSGTLSIVDAVKQGIKELTVDQANSDDNHIAFSFTLAKDIDLGTTLDFIVTKHPKNGTAVISAPLHYKVEFVPAPKATPVPASPSAAPNPTQSPVANLSKFTSRISSSANNGGSRSASEPS